MEIERKYLIHTLPEDLDRYPVLLIEQAYICTDPVIRIRREDDHFYVTCKGQGMLAREECNLPMSEQAYRNLLTKTEGTIITKKRYLIPIGNGLTAELDCFLGAWQGLQLAEVEFPDLETAGSFEPPSWFGEDVTYKPQYHNSWMSSHTREQTE